MEGTSNKLRLQWRDHGNELSKLSREIFGNDNLTDVTLTCRGGSPYHAHKMVLAAASTYFRKFFSDVECKLPQHQVIFMKDVAPAELEYLLQFIYLGEVDIPSTDLERLIIISRELGIVGLNAVKSEADEGVEMRGYKVARRKFAPTPKEPQIEQLSQEAPILKKSKVMRDSESIDYGGNAEGHHQGDEASQDFGLYDYGNDEGNEAREGDAIEDAEFVESYHVKAIEDVNSHNREMIKDKTSRRGRKGYVVESPLIGSVAQIMRGKKERSTLYSIGDYLYYNGTMQPNNTIRARCRNFRSGSVLCKACAFIEPVSLQILKLTGQHNCAKDPDMKIEIQMENEMKELAETTQDNLKQIYKKVCKKNPAVAQRIPFSRICKTMDRRRREVHA